MVAAERKKSLIKLHYSSISVLQMVKLEQTPHTDNSSLPYLLGLVSGIFLERYKGEKSGVVSRKAA